MKSEPAQFDPEAMCKMFSHGGHSGWLGLRYYAHGSDWVELELPWREDLLGDEDRAALASGPIIGLLDMVCGMSVWATRKIFEPVATLDLRVDYQRPVKERCAVIGRAQCYKITRSAAFVRGIAHDGDPENPVATMAGVFMNISVGKKEANGDEQ